jgi:hypothetical protein
MDAPGHQVGQPTGEKRDEVLGRLSLRPDDALHDRANWTPIDRARALVLQDTPVVVVFSNATGEHAVWFDRMSPFACGYGPFSLRGFRYLAFTGSAPAALQPGAGGSESKAPPSPAATKTRQSQRAPAQRAAPAQPAAAPPVEQKHWFEMELLDAQGKPVANEKFEVTLPGGAVKRGATDASGIVRLDDIPAGECKVKFPELKKRRKAS